MTIRHRPQPVTGQKRSNKARNENASVCAVSSGGGQRPQILAAVILAPYDQPLASAPRLESADCGTEPIPKSPG